MNYLSRNWELTKLFLEPQQNNICIYGFHFGYEVLLSLISSYKNNDDRIVTIFHNLNRAMDENVNTNEEYLIHYNILNLLFPDKIKFVTGDIKSYLLDETTKHDNDRMKCNVVWLTQSSTPETYVKNKNEETNRSGDFWEEESNAGELIQLFKPFVTEKNSLIVDGIESTSIRSSLDPLISNEIIEWETDGNRFNSYVKSSFCSNFVTEEVEGFDINRIIEGEGCDSGSKNSGDSIMRIGRYTNPTNNKNDDGDITINSCSLWTAPSTIPNAALGTFAGHNIQSGTKLRNEDMAVFFVSIMAKSENTVMNSYDWQCNMGNGNGMNDVVTGAFYPVYL